jgi:hypothetical protein
MVNVIIIVVGTFLMGLGGILPQDRKRNVFYRINFWTILSGVIVILVGSINANINQSKVESKLLEKTNKVEELSSRIKELSEQNISIITGGDNFPYIDVALYQGNLPQLIVHNTGKYPIYDINVRFFDIDKFNYMKSSGDTWKTIVECSVIKDIGNISPGFSQMISFRPILNWQDKTERRINIFITARNGYFVEKLRFKKIDRKWARALVLLKGEKQLLQKVDSDYPLNEEGKVVWSD